MASDRWEIKGLLTDLLIYLLDVKDAWDMNDRPWIHVLYMYCRRMQIHQRMLHYSTSPALPARLYAHAPLQSERRGYVTGSRHAYRPPSDSTTPDDRAQTETSVKRRRTFCHNPADVGPRESRGSKYTVCHNPADVGPRESRGGKYTVCRVKVFRSVVSKLTSSIKPTSDDR